MKDQQSAITFTDRRKHPRIKTETDVAYILLSRNRAVTDYGKGKILNLSQSGTLLETEKPLNGAFVVLVTMDRHGNRVKVPVKVVNSRKQSHKGGYRTGLEFSGPRQEQIRAIVAFVKAYNRRKQ